MSAESVCKRLELATPGPWIKKGLAAYAYPGQGDTNRLPATCITVSDSRNGYKTVNVDADTDLIAHAPTDLAAALRVIEAADELADHDYRWNHDQETICGCDREPYGCDVKDRYRTAKAEFEALP